VRLPAHPSTLPLAPPSCQLRLLPRSRQPLLPSTAPYPRPASFGRCPARAYMERLLPLVRAKRWPFTDIITHRLPLSQGVEAYRMFEAREEGVVKIVLDPWA
jgi:hypothetical protein